MGTDEFLYEKAAKEWASSAKPGLMAKCIAEAGGRNEGEALYINKRVEKWKREYREKKEQEEKRKAEEEAEREREIQREREREEEEDDDDLDDDHDDDDFIDRWDYGKDSDNQPQHGPDPYDQFA